MEAVSKDMLGLEFEEGILKGWCAENSSWVKSIVSDVAVTRAFR
jgi:hypothetical protein